MSDLREEPKTVDDLDPIMLEYPFVYEGMSMNDYREEHEYYWKHIKEVRDMTYKPLWKQRGEIH